jgi:hypothetical protein
VQRAVHMYRCQSSCVSQLLLAEREIEALTRRQSCARLALGQFAQKVGEA